MYLISFISIMFEAVRLLAVPPFVVETKLVTSWLHGMAFADCCPELHSHGDPASEFQGPEKEHTEEFEELLQKY